MNLSQGWTKRLAMVSLLGLCGMIGSFGWAATAPQNSLAIPIYNSAHDLRQLPEQTAFFSSFITTDEQWCDAPIKVYIAALPQGLAVIFEYQKPSNVPAEAARAERDAMAVFSGPCSELFIAPQNDGQHYYHIVAGDGGGIYDSQCQVPQKFDTSWNSQVKVTIYPVPHSDLQRTEMIIPYSSLSAAMPQAGRVCGLFFGRNYFGNDGKMVRAGAEKLSSWHQPERFFAARFTTAPIISAAPVFSPTLDSTRQNKVNFHFRNGFPQSRSATVSLSVDGKTWERQFILPPGDSKQDMAFSTAGEFSLDDGESPLQLKIHLGNGTNIVQEANFRRLLFRIEISDYYDFNQQLTVRLLENAIQNGRLMVTITAPDGREVWSQLLTPDAAPVKIDLRNFSAGRYLLSSRILLPSGEIAARQDRIFMIPTATLDAVDLTLPETCRLTIDDHGRFHLNEKLFLPLMISNTAPPLPGPAAFNVRGGADGLVPHALTHPGSPIAWKHLPCDGESCWSVDQITPIDTYIRKTAGRVFCRNLLYEVTRTFAATRQGKPVKVDILALLRKLNAEVKAAAPNDLTSIQLDGDCNYAEYQSIADILEVACWSSSYAVRQNRHLREDLLRIRSALPPNRPLMFWLGVSIPNPNCRTAEELRCAAYRVIMNGGDGIIFHNGHGGVPSVRTRLWSVFSGLARELTWLYPIIHAPAAPDTPKLACNRQAVEWQVKKYQGNDYLIAVNASPVRLEATFSGADCQAVELPLENRHLEVEHGTWTDTFTGYEPHVYRLISKQK